MSRCIQTVSPYLFFGTIAYGCANNIVPPEKTEGYAVMNIQAGSRFHIQKQQVQLSLQLQNVFNTRYLSHTSFYRLIGLPEQGRNLVISVKIPFNFLKNK